MKQKSLLQTQVEIKNESNALVTIQLVRTTVEDSKGEHEICPELYIQCEQKKPSKTFTLLFNTEQAEKLARQLIMLKDSALAYEKNKLQ